MTDCLPRLGIFSGLVFAVAVGLAIAGCTTVAPTDRPSTDAPTSMLPGPSSTIGTPPTTLGPPPSPTPDDASPLAIDPALLAILPADVAGVPVTESLDEATHAVGNAELQRVAAAVDAAVAVDAASGNLVYALVVQLRAGAFGEAAYRSWRDSYDEGACSAGGAVLGRLEAVMDGRTVHIGSCEGGFHTYHVLLTERDILISASSFGDGRFGELLVSNLRVDG